MQKHYDITRRRIKAFLDGGRLGGKIYAATQPIAFTSYAAPDRIPYAEAMRGDYQPAHIGMQFAPMWSTHWVRIDYTIPEDWRGGAVYLLWDSTCEACVWIDGQPQQGLTGTSDYWGEIKPLRTRFRIAESARGGESGTLYVEVAVNTPFGAVDLPAFNQVGLLRQAELALLDPEAWSLYWDMYMIVDMARYLPPDSARAFQALDAANEMVNAIQLDDRSTWAKGKALAQAFLAEKNGDSQHTVYAVGHAHIDTAWLWQIAETKRKIVRSVTNALRNIEDYPDFVYVFSQAQQYAWIKESYPGLYERLKAAVAAKRIIPVGGSWVEPDCNIPSGESLIRQFLYGQRFFEQEFGSRCEEFWLPDTFGYPPALPQIMRGAGIKYFLTQKLSWNQFNKPDRSTFIWEGLDGSQVLTHFPPADTYNATASIQDLIYGLKNFKDHERTRESMYVFGWGDGGGGPTDDMLERLERVKDVDGVPKVVMLPPIDFFRKAEERWDRYTKWIGELYFEMHRGTYTTQARNKMHNRACEILLRDAEILSALAMWQSGYVYPQAELDRLWKLLLLNQFHDILPGSSIGEVYQDSERDYAEIRAAGVALRQAALDALIPPASGSDANGVAEFINQNDAVHGIGFAARSRSAISAPGTQITQQGNLLVLTSLSGSASATKAIFNTEGQLLSYRAGQEVMTGAGGNNFVLYDDNPVNWDAWDVDVFHLEKHGEPLKASTAEIIAAAAGQNAGIRFVFDISERSRITQTVTLTEFGYLEFAHQIDWHEDHKLLRLEFPVNLRAEFATYEMQHGFVRRPTHYNTPYDLARFEVPAHGWVRLAEPGLSVALSSDYKYGYSVYGNVMRVTVLRAPTYPDLRADRGTHEFRCVLLINNEHAYEAARSLRGHYEGQPLLQPAARAVEGQSFFECAQLVIEAVKKAEDSDALIVRLVESSGAHGHAALRTSLTGIQRAVLCNLLEDELSELEWKGSYVEVGFKPFQVITLKLSR
ncbi:MAG: alpha-mannosidase [Anaerolinea sp.]|nr:alpha-mannosidase [Anaerolinea sp.]